MLRWLYSTLFQIPCTIQRALLKPRNKETRMPRLTTENTDYQLGWAALAKCRQMNFLFYEVIFIATSTLRLHNLNGRVQYTRLQYINMVEERETQKVYTNSLVNTDLFYPNFWLTQLFPRTKSSINQGVGVIL